MVIPLLGLWLSALAGEPPPAPIHYGAWRILYERGDVIRRVDSDSSHYFLYIVHAGTDTLLIAEVWKTDLAAHMAETRQKAEKRDEDLDSVASLLRELNRKIEPKRKGVSE